MGAAPHNMMPFVTHTTVATFTSNKVYCNLSPLYCCLILSAWKINTSTFNPESYQNEDKK